MPSTGEWTTPLVSLALPVYNGDAFIAETISSILAQDYQNFELIITDNASTDTTGVICKAFAASDKRIRYILNDWNLGAGPNHNLGFRQSEGTYFKWCAADDKISPNYIGACVEALERDPGAVLAYGTTQCIDQDGNNISLIGREMTMHDPRDSAIRRFYKDLLDRVTCTNFQAFALIRRDLLAQTDLHRSYYGSDQTLISELAMLGRFLHVPEAILYNREHPTRSMNIKEKRISHNWQDARSRKTPLPPNAYRLQHLIHIAVSHRHTVPLHQTLPVIAAWTSRKAADRVLSTCQDVKRRILGEPLA